MATSYDNRETCTSLLPSSCIPYTGVISDNIKDKLPECRPNINDVLKGVQERLDRLIYLFGETKNVECIGSTTGDFIQSDINEYVLSEIKKLKCYLNETGTINPESIKIAIDLLCFNDPDCFAKTEFSIQEVFEKLVSGYCDLTERVKNIELLLNI